MKKNNIRTVVYSLVCLFILNSCSKDFLDTKSPNTSLDSYFVSERNALLALTGCYNVLTWDENNYFPFFLGDILSHDSYKGGEGPGDQQWMEPLLIFNYQDNNPGLVEPYADYYIAINRCNTIIDNVPVVPDSLISMESKIEIVGEAKFIRGYFYFELVKMYGQVPLVRHALAAGQKNLPKASLADLWKQIENDFDSAAMVLPKKGDQVDAGRATKGAAQAFLCKAYVYQGKWDQTQAIADTIIASHSYDLEINYADNWLLSNKNGIESVFEIQFQNTGNANYGNSNSGNTFSVFCETRSDGTGYGFDCPTQAFVDQFEPGDVRLHATVIADGETLWPGTPDEMIADNHTGFQSNIDGYTTRKYQLPPSQRPTDDPSDAPNNWKVIRYAEVLLWRAEAAAHLGGDWKTDLNLVRNRAKLLNTTETDGLTAVYHEREVELGMEGQHFWDLIRQGRAELVLGKYGYVESKNHYYPIPSVQKF